MIFSWRTIPNALGAALRFVRTLFSKDPVLATSAVSSIREYRCENCVWNNREGQCELCTCVIALKVKMASESCPDEQWGKQTRFSNGLDLAASIKEK